MKSGYAVFSDPKERDCTYCLCGAIGYIWWEIDRTGRITRDVPYEYRHFCRYHKSDADKDLTMAKVANL